MTTRLTYNLSDLRELRANNWQPCGNWITLSATDPNGHTVTITTNGGGEGLFSNDYLHQYTGTCQFSICGWSDRKAREELRRRYNEMIDQLRREEAITTPSCIYFTYGDKEVRFETRADAVSYLEDEGYQPSGVEVFESSEQFRGTIEFWVHAGNSLDEYTDGYEPRLYVGEEIDAVY